MSDYNFDTRRIKARKPHHCNAFDWIDNSNLGPDDVTKAEWAAIEECRSSQIQVGAYYLSTEGWFEGEKFHTRSRDDMNDICIKYGLYD